MLTLTNTALTELFLSSAQSDASTDDVADLVAAGDLDAARELAYSLGADAYTLA